MYVCEQYCLRKSDVACCPHTTTTTMTTTTNKYTISGMTCSPVTVTVVPFALTTMPPPPRVSTSLLRASGVQPQLLLGVPFPFWRRCAHRRPHGRHRRGLRELRVLPGSVHRFRLGPLRLWLGVARADVRRFCRGERTTLDFWGEKTAKTKTVSTYVLYARCTLTVGGSVM